MESFFDEYEHYNFDKGTTDVYKTRKGRSKKETGQRYNFDPSGNVRKTVEKLRNTEARKKAGRLRRTKSAST